MTEIFKDISRDARDAAESAFNLAMMLHNPAESANFLHNFTEYYVAAHPEPEIQEFLNFYFNMRLEALSNNEDTSTVG